jgi:four helix bundle protein
VSHPAYKDHPLWKEAIALVEAAYALAEASKAAAPVVARHLRKVAVSVPANIAEALVENPDKPPTESRALARGALAEIERQTLFLPDEFAEAADALAARARKMYREMTKELETEETFS